METSHPHSKQINEKKFRTQTAEIQSAAIVDLWFRLALNLRTGS